MYRSWHEGRTRRCGRRMYLGAKRSELERMCARGTVLPGFFGSPISHGTPRAAEVPVVWCTQAETVRKSDMFRSGALAHLCLVADQNKVFITRKTNAIHLVIYPVPPVYS